jgi:tripartite-type tricarboxylate transporter receptor subunit TctC
MRFPRRKFFHLAAGAVALRAFSNVATAQTYPTKPVRIVNGFAAGGTGDIFARLIGQWLSERLGQQITVEDRTGAASNIATEMVVRSPADGYTLLLATPANAINATLYEKLGYNFLTDVVPVTGVARVPNVMEVNPSLPVRSVPEFIEYAKRNPGKINMGSGGAGTTPHVFGELFRIMTGINMIHVPYRGAAPALTDLLGGQIQVLFDPIPSSLDHIRAGRVRALGVTAATRSASLPNVPSLAEYLPGYEASFWCGIVAPRNTPADIVTKLNRAANAALAEPKAVARLADLSATALSGTSADFGKFIADKTEKWGKVIRAANIKAQ